MDSQPQPPDRTAQHDAYCLKCDTLPPPHGFLQELEELLKKHGTISGSAKKQAIALIKSHSQNGYIYCIRCRVNSRAYVGQTTDFENRMRQHTRRCPGSMSGDWCSHGIKNFVVEILEEVSTERLLEREAFWQRQISAVYSDRELGFYSADQRPVYFNEYESADLTRKMLRVQRERIREASELCRKAGHIDEPYSGSGDSPSGCADALLFFGSVASSSTSCVAIWQTLPPARALPTLAPFVHKGYLSQ